jgi:hypothetical protein
MFGENTRVPFLILSSTVVAASVFFFYEKKNRDKHRKNPR